MITEQEVKEKTIERFWNKIKFSTSNECWIWQAAKVDSGYGTIKINRKSILAHRHMYFKMFEEIANGIQVCHSCDNPSCCNPNHLFAGTQKDNVDDMIKKGRGSKPPLHLGSKTWCSKLTESNVSEIKRRLSAHEKVKNIAHSFNVDPSQISRIKLGERWKHVS